jgi:hypothetical protein
MVAPLNMRPRTVMHGYCCSVLRRTSLRLGLKALLRAVCTVAGMEAHQHATVRFRLHRVGCKNRIKTETGAARH